MRDPVPRVLPSLSWEAGGTYHQDHMNSLCYYNRTSMPGLRSASSYLPTCYLLSRPQAAQLYMVVMAPSKIYCELC